MCYYYTAETFYNDWIEETKDPDDSIEMDHLSELTTAVNLHGEPFGELIRMLPLLNWNTERYYTLRWKKPLPQYVIDQAEEERASYTRIRSGNMRPEDHTKLLTIPTDFNRIRQ